ncbi:MAG: 3-oxoacid CoA-transferase [Oscillospiraceae bacterium]|nr:3-oxoacid CoA-transferase [Oscillospiraceae bacterium]
MSKIITAAAAAALVKDRSTLAVGGFAAYAVPETLLYELGRRFDETSSPEGLTVTCGICPGDYSRDPVGLNRIAKKGLLDTVIAAHFGNPPLIGDMIAENLVAGYALPLGVMVHLFEAIAGHKGAVLSHVGLGTFADPREEGCKVNKRAREQNRTVVELLQVAGREQLAYLTFPIDICFVRASLADSDGNLSAENEAVGDVTFGIAAAAHNSGGIVIAEVERIVPPGTLNPRNVVAHGSIVDYVVQADPELYRQGYASVYRPELCGRKRIEPDTLPPLPMSNRKLIARRAAMELAPGGLINLGIGIPSGIGSVANEEGIHATLSLESGPQGGVPLDGLGFGANVNAEAIYSLSDTFHLYDGGVLSMSFLGAAEVDEAGNVNVSRFGDSCTGPGGFINISQNTPSVRFVCTFTAGGLKEEIRDGQLVILQEGRQKKFVKSVRQITFSGKYARSTRQDVQFITERAVFRLTEEGLLLTEIAPGVDLERDILSQMEFTPRIAGDLSLMDPRIFRDSLMGLNAQ